MVKHCYSIKHLLQFYDKPFIYERKSEYKEHIFNYGYIIQEIRKCIDCFQQNQIENHIGVAFNIHEHTATSCILLLSILNYNCHFYCLDFNGTNDVKSLLRLSSVKYLISKDIQEIKQIPFEVCFSIRILDEHFFMLRLNMYTESFTKPGLCYTISTSGSTGLPKIVHVQYKSVAPNIKALSFLLKLKENDLIFLGSPPTFDPFVVEIFLALYRGAAILITCNKIRLQSQSLLKILFPSQSYLRGVSILQTTPSLFRLFGYKNIKNLIFNKSSSLRCLILGGEEFPAYAELKSWLPLYFHSSGKRIFNIYGITEVSCWSTIYEFDANIHFDYIRTPLGKTLDDYTLLRIIDEDDNVLPKGIATGQLVIGSSKRRCYIPICDQSIDMLDSNDIVYRKTGDIVERDDFGYIYYIGRTNNSVKRFGKRLCLDSLSKKIECILTTLHLYTKVVCLWHKERTKLIFYLNSHNSNVSEKMYHLLRSSLEEHEQPDEIYWNNEIPLNHHGKLDRAQLLETLLTLKQKQAKSPLDIFKTFVKNVFGINYVDQLQEECQANSNRSKKRVKCDLSTSFTNAGGTSFQALSLATELAELMENPEDQRRILELLLDSNVTIIDIFEFLSSTANKLESMPVPLKNPSNITHSLKLLWRRDLKKCVDASPTVYQEDFVTVGSHSHLLLSINTKTGKEISRLQLPDRIECSVVYVSSVLALVGCYDGFLYGFNFNTGSIEFKFNVNGMVKAKPLVINNVVVVASYAEEYNVMAFNITSLECLWSIKLGTKGIFSSPLKVSEDFAILCSLDGSYTLINIYNGHSKWLNKLESPIFSTPAKIQLKNILLVIAEVKGQVIVCTEETGEKITSYQADGNIFSSLTLLQHNSKRTLIIFGCHDKQLYCLNFENDTKTLTLSWKYALNSAIYSTPVLISTRYVLSCSTKGLMVLIDLATSDLKGSYDLNAEIFSTPSCLNDNLIYVGARDNFLYAFQLL